MSGITPYLTLVFDRYIKNVERSRKITVEIPPELLDRVQRASGNGYYPDSSYGFAARRGLADLFEAAKISWQGSLHSDIGRPKSRPMIEADASTWIAFFQGEPGEDVEQLDRALEDRSVLMAPPVDGVAERSRHLL